MSKHTQGPWRIDLETQHDCSYSRSSNAIVGANGEPVVLFDPSESEYSWALDPDSADARLIAAAPDLLAALELIVQVYDQGHGIECVIGAGRTAIAKATGEKP